MRGGKANNFYLTRVLRLVYYKVMAEEMITKKDIRQLLGVQTKQIEKRLSEQTDVILTAVDERIKALDLKFTEKFDKLTTTLDNFLKRI